MAVRKIVRIVHHGAVRRHTHPLRGHARIEQLLAVGGLEGDAKLARSGLPPPERRGKLGGHLLAHFKGRGADAGAHLGHAVGGHGLTPDLIQYTHFVALRALATKVPLGRHFSGTAVPQVFYLSQDGHTGTYWNVVLELAKNRFPVTVNANLSRTIRSEIVGKEFLWSVGLVYNINQTYRRVD